MFYINLNLGKLLFCENTIKAKIGLFALNVVTGLLVRSLIGLELNVLDVMV